MASNWITGFSGLPLQLSFYMGLFISFCSLLFSLRIIYAKLFLNIPVAGWTSLIVSILFFGGVQLTFLGLIGYYQWLTLQETRKRPLYYVEKSTFNNVQD